MTDAERTRLHDDLARLLAPIVGAEAVYTGRDICGNRHALERLGDGSWAHDADTPLSLGCGGVFDHRPEPRTLTDFAVLEPLLRRVCREREWTRELMAFRNGEILAVVGGVIPWDMGRAAREQKTDADAWAVSLRAALESEDAST